MHFSIQQLICEGRLGPATSAMTRKQVHECLGSPDDWMKPSRGPRLVEHAPIWRYGNFEVHFFQDDAVGMLFLDYLDEPDAGTNRSLDRWILREPWERTLEATSQRLREEGVDFTLCKDRRTLLRIEGGADLIFSEVNGSWEWGAISVNVPGV